jgi:tetratricopeptide (TPR) repeat protein
VKSTPSTAAPTVGPRARALTLIALAVATLAAYAGLWNCDWIQFDDPVYVRDNAYIAAGFTIDGLRWVLTHPHGGNFHPLTSMSHMLDCQIFGIDPRGPHMVNLVLHIANAMLVCSVLARLTGAWWRSALVAAFFALHPLRVESVAWISERKDVLSTLFFLLSLEAYRRWTHQPTRARYGWLVACFTLGLLAKPMLVTLPFVLLLLDIWPLERTGGRLLPSFALWREKIPLFAIALIASATTFLVQRAAGAMMSSQALPLGARVLNALAAYLRYLRMTFAPYDLAAFYPNAGAVGVALPMISAAVLCAVTIAAWKQRALRPWLSVGWLWFVGTLIPVIGIVQVGDQALADRYTYIPSIGLCIAVVWCGAEFARRARPPRVAIGAAIAALALCGVATARQVALWRNSTTLFAHAVAVTSDNALAHQVLGGSLLADGHVDEAIEHLEIALKLSPDFPDAHANLGSALGIKQRYEEAIAHFRAALRTQDTPIVHYNLGTALVRSGHGDEAIHEFETALALEPRLPGPDASLGALLAARNRLDEASMHLSRALEMAPGDVEAHRSMAITRTLQGRVEEGIAEYGAVLERSPKDLDALNNIAWIRATHADAQHRNGAEAVRLAEEARDAASEPNHVLFSTLAAAYAEAGRFNDAVRAAERAIELARAAQDDGAAQRFDQQLANYRARRPFHL